ncbi:sugar phosphate isomerase/epimerase family protein [Dysosmobacter sp.]|uniref:sugar phosphate isomerase/epimerase family protein n=1 Tax=Dysosmobacter sp. TaxID=2591382 RepID=UPI003AB74CC1
MKIAGHTMSTPELSVEEALAFFTSLGLEGAEVVVQSDYKSGIPYEADNNYILSLREFANNLGIKIVALTPYLNRYNDLDENVRAKESAGLMRIIDMAQVLGAGSIRIYGGAFKDDETDSTGEKLQRLVKTLRECGDYAQNYNIKLSIENHFGTMATTATKTMKIIEAVNHPAVGVLYDQANLAFFPAEEYQEAIDLQKGHITWVHVKDLVYRGGKPQKFKSDSVSHISEEIRTVFSRFPGDGVLDWPSILKYLRDVGGYDGWLSLEYERRWGKTDLPPAVEGLPVCVERLRNWLKELDTEDLI